MHVSKDRPHRTGLTQIFQPGKPALIPYVMAGDPDIATTRAIAATLAKVGAAAIELGVPYGDPLADGPTIAAAGIRALQSGTRLTEVLALAAQLQADGCPPIVLFTYFNPVLQYGIDRFASHVAGAGVGGVIVPDIALEEGDDLRTALAARAIDMPLLVAPITARDRAARVCAESTGFVYVVSRLGVTGSGTAPDFGPLQSQVAMLRELTSKPLAVGFGVSNADHVREVAPLVDGIVVGSALIDSYAGYAADEAAQRVEGFIRSLALP